MEITYRDDEPPKYCGRADCSVSSMGWHRYYKASRFDKSGNEIPIKQPALSVERECEVCGARWSIYQTDSDGVGPTWVEVRQQPNAVGVQ